MDTKGSMCAKFYFRRDCTWSHSFQYGLTYDLLVAILNRYVLPLFKGLVTYRRNNIFLILVDDYT